MITIKNNILSYASNVIHLESCSIVHAGRHRAEVAALPFPTMIAEDAILVVRGRSLPGAGAMVILAGHILLWPPGVWVGAFLFPEPSSYD